MADAEGTVEPGCPTDDGNRRALRSWSDLDLAQSREVPRRQQLDDGLLGGPAACQTLPAVGAVTCREFGGGVDAVQKAFSIPFPQSPDTRHGHYVHAKLFHYFSIAAKTCTTQPSP